MSEETTPPSVPRWVWLAVILLSALLVAMIAGLLAHAAGSGVPAAILTAGGTFGGAVVFLLGVAHFLLGK